MTVMNTLVLPEDGKVHFSPQDRECGPACDITYARRRCNRHGDAMIPMFHELELFPRRNINVLSGLFSSLAIIHRTLMVPSSSTNPALT